MKFTKEWIEKCRQKIGFGWSSTGQSTISAIAKLALDEIERLQAERDQVCEWTGKYKRYHEITGDILFRVTKTSCSDSHDDIVSVVDFTYCPNCGKRIKYVEVE